MKLSASQGISGWSIRDIASELDVVPSVIYHYYANKEALCDAVVDQVFTEITVPDQSLAWKDWFTQMAHNLRPVLLTYHGITDRLARGKFTETFLPTLDAAYNKLLEAGFGDKAPLAYTIISTAIIQAIAARNLRSINQREDPHDLKNMLARLQPMMSKSVGLSQIIGAYLKPLANPELEETMSAQYFDLMVATILDGVEHVLLPQAQPGNPGKKPSLG
ncbi:TetR/AcrR family transcriptional regulator [Gleimia sp. 6138-11-ORH1]|uniref:TetR/AcrR family transcriptional regulator n=1 Tax=Gleimia sp. 6138-11-ORH1 TaxID=2973937 RepID=UPI0021691BB4|nr:TetR/AcrR family transcriptional regulator [Gleimia sp. 6138-11-ORH1]MCS4484473.1 TetR/AcrR family transcriptional regulator [Gleimia sp. 6138-11-ORH1]